MDTTKQNEQRNWFIQSQISSSDSNMLEHVGNIINIINHHENSWNIRGSRLSCLCPFHGLGFHGPCARGTDRWARWSPRQRRWPPAEIWENAAVITSDTVPYDFGGKKNKTSWDFMSFSNLFWSISMISMCSPFFNLFLSLVFLYFSLSSSIFLAFHAFAHWQALRCHWAPLQPTSPGPLGLWSGASPAKQSCSWCKYQILRCMVQYLYDAANKSCKVNMYV